MITNKTNISLPIAAWLADAGGYDLNYDPMVISATTLLRPLRSVILSRKIIADNLDSIRDVSDMIAAKTGTAVHNEVEAVWENVPETALLELGYPQSVIDRMVLNMPPDTLTSNEIPLYFELRNSKPVPKFPQYTISGKFDFVIEGMVHDIKTTKVYNWIHGGNNHNYVKQGSIYRWLNLTIITDDHMIIDYIFKDWSPLKAQIDKEYPPTQILAKKLKLKSIAEIEKFINEHVGLIHKYTGRPQAELPLCTPEELWQKPAKFAYYKNPQGARATKLYDSYQEAVARQYKEQGVGAIVERKAKPTFCEYCNARTICTQAEGFVAEGLLENFVVPNPLMPK